MKRLSGFALGIGVKILFVPIGKKIATKSPPERPNLIIYNGTQLIKYAIELILLLLFQLYIPASLN